MNGEKTEGGRWLNEGDCITWVESENKPPKIYPLDLSIIYEDNYIAIIEKPAGICVSGNQYKTVYNALGHNLIPSTAIDALPWPLPAHRLDNQTRGLLLIAKTAGARIKLGHDFECKAIHKIYHALVVGKPEKKGEIKVDIDEKKAQTSYELISYTPACKGGYLSLLKLTPHTGRTHQLRIHCAHIGSPILGDSLYSKEELLLKNKGLFLAATGIRLSHPITGDHLSFDTAIPEKFCKRMTYEKRRNDHFQNSRNS